MKRLSSVQELADFRQSVLREQGLRCGVPTLVVCAGTGGQASGANDLIRAIKRHILDRGLQERVHLRITGCQGFCEMDPFILVQPGRQLYPKLTMEDVPRVIDAAVSGTIEPGLLYRDTGDGKQYESQDQIPFFRHQTRTILGANERLDPIRVRASFPIERMLYRLRLGRTEAEIRASITVNLLRPDGGIYPHADRSESTSVGLDPFTEEAMVIVESPEPDSILRLVTNVSRLS